MGLSYVRTGFVFDHVCTTVLSKIKILFFFYLSPLLNREERDYSPLVAGAVSAYTTTYKNLRG